jgi:predicted RNA-binding Zn-ribbon protein involved in translation (DUF1610 family)
MTTIKATCPMCGDVDLTPRDVHVTVARTMGWATYEFDCPTCHDTITKKADDEVVHLLAGAGVQIDRVEVPDEVIEEMLIAETGTALTNDDLLDFALWLAQTDDVVAAFADV